jgi:hypothetical protein
VFLATLSACASEGGSTIGAGNSSRRTTARAGSAAVASISKDFAPSVSPEITGGATDFKNKKLTVDLGADYGSFFADLKDVVGTATSSNAKTLARIGVTKDGVASDGLGLAPSFKGPNGSAYDADGNRVKDTEIIAGVQKSAVIERVTGRIVLGDLNDPNTVEKDEDLKYARFGYVALDVESAHNPGDTTYWDLLRLATAVQDKSAFDACVADSGCNVDNMKRDGYASAKLHDGSTLEYSQFTWGNEEFRITDQKIAAGKSAASFKFRGRALGGIVQEQKLFVTDFSNNGSYIIAPVSADLSGTAEYEFHPMNRGRDKLVLELGVAGSSEAPPLTMTFKSDKVVNIAGSLAGFDAFSGGKGEFEAKFYGKDGSPSEVVGGFAYKHEAVGLLTSIIGAYGAKK